MKVQTYNDTSAMAAGRLDGTGEIPMRITKSVYNIPLNRDRNKGLRCKRSHGSHRRAMLADFQQLKYTLLKNLLSVEK